MSRVKGTVFTDDDIQRFRATNPLKRLEARLSRNEVDRAKRKLTISWAKRDSVSNRDREGSRFLALIG